MGLSLSWPPCCRARAPDAQAQQLWLTGLVAQGHVGSSQTRARTRVPCIGRWTLNHCATREALKLHLIVRQCESFSSFPFFIFLSFLSFLLLVFSFFYPLFFSSFICLSLLSLSCLFLSLSCFIFYFYSFFLFPFLLFLHPVSKYFSSSSVPDVGHPGQEFQPLLLSSACCSHLCKL